MHVLSPAPCTWHPATQQVARLAAVLSVRGVLRSALLQDDEDAGVQLEAKLTDAERTLLQRHGWQPGCGLRTLVNFTGEQAEQCCGVVLP